MEVNLTILVNKCLIIIVGYVMSITAEWSPGSVSTCENNYSPDGEKIDPFQFCDHNISL